MYFILTLEFTFTLKTIYLLTTSVSAKYYQVPLIGRCKESTLPKTPVYL